MASLNTVSTTQSYKNTGLVSRPFDPKRMAGIILTPKGYAIAAANISASGLQTKLTADAANDTKSSRIYPVANLLDVKDNSEKPVEQAFSTGAYVTVRDGVIKLAFQFTKGAQTLQQALRAFNGPAMDFFFVDDNNTLIGTAYTDSTGAKGIKAIPSIEVWTDAWMPNDGKKVTEYNIRVGCFPKYLNDLLAYVMVDPNLEFDIMGTVVGLKDVNLVPVASGTSGTYYVTVVDDAGANLYGELSSSLVVSTWVITNDSTGASITPTSVTPDPVNQRFTIVVPTTGAYPTGTQKIRFNLQGPTELIAASVEAIECVSYVSIAKN